MLVVGKEAKRKVAPEPICGDSGPYALEKVRDWNIVDSNCLFCPEDGQRHGITLCFSNAPFSSFQNYYN